ncbi:flagellar basal-body rod protein FlgG, partial [Shigella boydii]|nr:flagellar basal-body rod protein FlgG [Shigella boydii]
VKYPTLASICPTESHTALRFIVDSNSTSDKSRFTLDGACT